MMETKSFQGLEDIRVYVLAEEFANEIWDEVMKWGVFARDTLGKQLVRSADSIAANIAESYGRYHPRDVVNFLYHSRGSLCETKSWLRRAQRRRLLSEARSQELLTKLEGLAPQLNAYISSKRKRIT